MKKVFKSKPKLYELVEKTSFSFSQDEGYLGAVQKHFQERINNLRLLLSLRSQDRDLEPEIFILSCCFIDALASIFYDIKSSVRFRRILYDFGEFRDVNFNMASLIELEKILQTKEFDLLKNDYLAHIVKKIDNIDYACISEAFKSDPLKSVLSAELLEINKENAELLKEAIENASYASVLLKKYRNPAIHEGIPKNHWTIADENCAHYMGILDARADLVFPAKFLVDFIENIFQTIFNKISEQLFDDRVNEECQKNASSR